MRCIITAVVLTLYIRKPRFTWSFEQVGAALSFSATVILFVLATKLTTAANAIILQYTAPIYTVLFGRWFLKEETFWFDWLAVAAVICGMVLFFLDRLTVGGSLGNVIAIISGLTTSWLGLFMRKQKRDSPLESIILGSVFTAIICLPFMFSSVPSLHGWIGLFILGVFQLGVPFILYSAAIKYVTALDAILICTLEPIFNPIWVLLFLKEAPGPWAILGGGIVIVSVTLRSVYSKAKKR